MTALEYRIAMRAWATGVAVLTLDAEGETRGITVNSFTSVSLDPPLILVCIARRARVHDALLRASRFCINVLARGQQDLADHFAGRGSEDARRPTYDLSRHATPVLPGCLAHLDCALVASHAAGDHTIVVAAVEAVENGRGEDPLLFFGGRYESLAAGLGAAPPAGATLTAS